MACRLSPKARDDLETVWLYTAGTWSVERADLYVDGLVRVFDLIADLPEMGRAYAEFTPPVRIHVHGVHLIVYRAAGEDIDVLRILGGSQDWRSILRALDP